MPPFPTSLPPPPAARALASEPCFPRRGRVLARSTLRQGHAAASHDQDSMRLRRRCLTSPPNRPQTPTPRNQTTEAGVPPLTFSRAPIFFSFRVPFPCCQVPATGGLLTKAPVTATMSRASSFFLRSRARGREPPPSCAIENVRSHLQLRARWPPGGGSRTERLSGWCGGGRLQDTQVMLARVVAVWLLDQE